MRWRYIVECYVFHGNQHKTQRSACRKMYGSKFISPGVRFKPSLSHSLDCGNLSGTPSGNNPLVVVRQRYRLASGVLALCLGNGDTLALALEDVLAFEFCDRRKRHSRRRCRNKHNDTIADNNRFSWLSLRILPALTASNLNKKTLSRHGYSWLESVFISLLEQHKRAEFYLLCEQCIAPRIGLPDSFSRRTPPSA